MRDLFIRTTHRRELERLLRQHAHTLTGQVLDAGSGSRRYDHLFAAKVTAVDLRGDPSKGIIAADVNALPFPDRSFDGALAIELFEYLTTPDRAMRELRRVLKPGGRLILTVPLMYRYHGDQLRYTERYLRDVLFRDWGDVTVRSIGNYYTIFLDALTIKAHKVRSRLRRYLVYLVLTPWFLLRPLFEAFAHDPEIASGYFVTARRAA